MLARATLASALVFAALAGCQYDLREEPLGAFEVRWVLMIDEERGRCREAGAATVRVTYEAKHARYRFRDSFPCEQGAAEAGYLPLDDYEVQSRLLGPEGRELERGDPMEVSLSEPRAVTVLPTVTFRVQTPPVARFHSSQSAGSSE